MTQRLVCHIYGRIDKAFAISDDHKRLPKKIVHKKKPDKEE